MKTYLKKIIFTFVAVGLLWSVQGSLSSDFQNKFVKTEVASDSSESTHDCESEDLKISNYNSDEFFPSSYQLKITQYRDEFLCAKYSPSVPTSPPNA